MRLRDQAATFELRTQLSWSDQLLETPETTALSLYFSAGYGQQTATREKSGEYSNDLQNNSFPRLQMPAAGMFPRVTVAHIEELGVPCASEKAVTTALDLWFSDSAGAQGGGTRCHRRDNSIVRAIDQIM